MNSSGCGGFLCGLDNRSAVVYAVLTFCRMGCFTSNHETRHTMGLSARRTQSKSHQIYELCTLKRTRRVVCPQISVLSVHAMCVCACVRWTRLSKKVEQGKQLRTYICETCAVCRQDARVLRKKFNHAAHIWHNRHTDAHAHVWCELHATHTQATYRHRLRVWCNAELGLVNIPTTFFVRLSRLTSIAPDPQHGCAPKMEPPNNCVMAAFLRVMLRVAMLRSAKGMGQNYFVTRNWSKSRPTHLSFVSLQLSWRAIYDYCLEKPCNLVRQRVVSCVCNSRDSA